LKIKNQVCYSITDWLIGKQKWHYTTSSKKKIFSFFLWTQIVKDKCAFWPNSTWLPLNLRPLYTRMM
jgi:hypothetical protein